MLSHDRHISIKLWSLDHSSLFDYGVRGGGRGFNIDINACIDPHSLFMIGANGSVRGKKDSSLARWPPNPSRCWALT